MIPPTKRLLANDLPKDFRLLARTALGQDWTIRRTGGAHYQWLSPDGLSIVTTSNSASDRRALKNAERMLVNRGLKL